jgi:23S rRNA pseudouridine1911/1915/1917 synthase
VQKTYVALVEGHPPKEGKLTDWLLRTEQDDNVQIVMEGTKDARPSSLSYQVITRVNNSSLVHVQLETGRMHQIRVQFSSRGWPVLGDVRYGAKQPLGQPPKNDPRLAAIALHAYQLKIKHPVRYDDLVIKAGLPATWKKLGVDEGLLEEYFG